MKRHSEAWFEFGGIKNTELGVEMISMPARNLPIQRGKSYCVSGRSGMLWRSDGAYDNVEISLEFIVPDEVNIIAVNGWLSGSGLLRFSDEPEYAYEARISRNFKRQSVTPRMTAQRYAVTFTCHPFRLLYPEADAFTISASGSTFNNPGTAPSKPRLKITGSGDFSVTIGMETLFFSGVTDGGIIVDSQLMDALTYDGALLANDRISGMPWTLQPGWNVVSWLTETGSYVSGIEITPRWRYL